jgi:hypothetical protein
MFNAFFAPVDSGAPYLGPGSAIAVKARAPMNPV